MSEFPLELVTVEPLSDESKLSGPRISSLVHCPRMAVYQYLKAPKEEQPWLEGYFARGRWCERYVMEDLWGGGDYWRQVQIGWRIPGRDEVWWCHPDAVHKDPDIYNEKRLVHLGGDFYGLREIKSRKNAKDISSDHDQAFIYSHLLPGITDTRVCVVDPSDYSVYKEYETNLSMDGPVAERVMPKIEKFIRYFEAATLPDRVCRTPSDAQKHNCSCPTHCFEGWEPSPPETFFGIEDDVHAFVEDKDEEAEARLLDILAPGEETVVDGYRISYQEKQTTASLKLKAYLDAQGEIPEPMKPYYTPSVTKPKWKIEKVVKLDTGGTEGALADPPEESEESPF